MAEDMSNEELEHNMKNLSKSIISTELEIELTGKLTRKRSVSRSPELARRHSLASESPEKDDEIDFAETASSKRKRFQRNPKRETLK